MQKNGLVYKPHICAKGILYPPFDTKTELRKKLESMYREVEIKTVISEACFYCRKGE